MLLNIISTSDNYNCELFYTDIDPDRFKFNLIDQDKNSKTLKTLPKEDLVEVEEMKKVYTLEEKEEFTINRADGMWIVEGPGVERIMRRVNLDDNESMHYFHKSLDRLGVNQALKKAGVKEGDTVSIDGWELEWYD